MFLEKVYSGINKWYLYIYTLLIVFVATQLGTFPMIGYIFLENPEILQGGDIAIVTSTNMGLFLVLFSFMVGVFVLFFCIKHIHCKKSLDIVTARPHIDWRRVLFSAGIWGSLTLLTFAVQFAFTDTSDIIFQFDAQSFFILLFISLLMFPFQTSFEELVFRGYLMQWSALLFKYRWVAVLLTSLLFGLMHLANSEVKEFGTWVALPQYILMGLILGLITVMDDGLELALGLHFVNNLIAAVTFTSDASTLRTHALFKDLDPTTTHLDTLMMLVAGIIFIWICNRKYHFIGKINLWEKITRPTHKPDSVDSFIC